MPSCLQLCVKEASFRPTLDLARLWLCFALEAHNRDLFDLHQVMGHPMQSIS